MMIVKVSKTKLAELEITKLRICSQITICEDRNGDDEDRNGLYDKDKIICIFICKYISYMYTYTYVQI